MSQPVGPPRVRPPRPWPTGVRIGVGVAFVVVLLVGFGLVKAAQDSDGGVTPGAAWRTHPYPPRAADLDDFGGSGGPLGRRAVAAGWTVEDGLLRSGAGDLQLAVVPAGGGDVLVYAQVVSAAPGSGLVVAGEADGAPGGIQLVAAPDEGWILQQAVDGTPVTIERYDAPTEQVAVQLVVQDGEATVSFDRERRTTRLPEPSPDPAAVGVVARSAGTTLDLFGSLALDAG